MFDIGIGIMATRRTGRDIVRKLRAEFGEMRVVTTKNGHVRLVAPNGTSVVMSSTPSDHREYPSTRARLKRAFSFRRV
jgi:hypothetical protein